MNPYTSDQLRNIVLVGHSRAGKTTLVRSLLGQMPYEGTIRLDGISGRPVIGYAPQSLDIDRTLPLVVMARATGAVGLAAPQAKPAPAATPSIEGAWRLNRDLSDQLPPNPDDQGGDGGGRGRGRGG